MRTPPDHVLKALRSYEPGLSLVGNADGSWTFTWKGRRLSRWMHRDGTPAINDLSADEALAIVRQWDNRHYGSDRLKALDHAADLATDRAGRDRNRRLSETSQEARQRISFAANGPRPFVSLNPSRAATAVPA